MKEQIITEGGQVHLKKTQDISGILRDNAAMRNITQTGDVRKIASIPNVMIVELKDKYGIDLFNLNKESKQRLMKLLNSSEFKHLKTINGMA